MLEMILDKQIFFVLMGIFTVLGLVSKWVANASLKRLARAAGNMGKSAHPLMRLIRAKFEHACMISERVENVGAFVDKYLYEYKVAGMKLHTWRRLEKLAAGMCFLLGLLGAAAWYGAAGMQEMVLRTGAAGAGLGILILLVHMATDEDYQLEAARNYMVDYLENVCLHRYEKAYQKELSSGDPEDTCQGDRCDGGGGGPPAGPGGGREAPGGEGPGDAQRCAHPPDPGGVYGLIKRRRFAKM